MAQRKRVVQCGEECLIGRLLGGSDRRFKINLKSLSGDDNPARVNALGVCLISRKCSFRCVVAWRPSSSARSPTDWRRCGQISCCWRWYKTVHRAMRSCRFCWPWRPCCWRHWVRRMISSVDRLWPFATVMIPSLR